MERLIWALMLLVVLPSCASAPEEALRADFISSSPVWFDDLERPNIEPQKVRAYKLYPERAQAPYPAVIILHSSQGLGVMEWEMTARLNEVGIAALLIDSFTLRGVTKIIKDQTVVSEVTMMADLYAGYESLKRDTKIDTSRIAVAGFSKGALPVLYTGYNSLAQLFGYAQNPFAAHLAFYPWCGVRLVDQSVSGAPIEIHGGAADQITPLSLCHELAERSDGAITIQSYAVAGHAFNHPYLNGLPSLPIGYPYPKDCVIEEQDDGQFIERHSGKTLTSKNFSRLINGCSQRGAFIKGNESAAQTADQAAIDFLIKSLRDENLYSRSENN